MKGKVIMEIAGNRVLVEHIAFLFAILLTAINSGCSYAPTIIPEELRGIYKTTHRKYENQFFELDSKLVIMSFGGDLYKYYNVRKIDKEIIDNRILYTILCTNEDEGEEFNFAFFVDFAGEVIIHFKNKSKIAWIKQGAVAHNSDNLVSKDRY